MAEDQDRGKPRRRRLLWWIVPPVMLVLGAVAVFGLWREYQGSSPFHVGACFQAVEDTGIVAADGLRQVSGRAKVVSCAAAHDAEITRTVRQASDCAAEGAWLESREQIYCVALSE